MNRKQRRAARKQAGRDGHREGPSPSSWTALSAQASLCQQQGRLKDAARLYGEALALEPDHAELHNNLGCVLLAQGKPADASRHFEQALRLTPELFETYANISALLIQLNPVIGQARARAEKAWPRLVPLAELLDGDGMAAIAGDPLLRYVLQAAPVRELGLEALLTCLRAAMLDRVAAEADAGLIEATLLDLGCSIARQCFLNEYVFAVTAEEMAQVERLRQAVAGALASGRPIPPSWLMAMASYEPLASLADAAALLTRRWPDAVDDLLTQQLREPQEELGYRELMPRLTGIADAVSRQVRQQYEENPYPRWALAPSRREPQSVVEYLRQQFPSAAFGGAAASGNVEILIAGCGTGWHAIEIAQRFKNARLLAVDLSLSSLCYAKRKARELELDQIEFAQADILQIASIGRAFDVIDASGVLHHLAEPMRGWRILLSLLRPGGFMHVGLYSALARRDVVAARAWIAERGYRPSADDIRRCRQELMSTPLRGMARAYEFFSTSELRDLLFHVQEQRLTIPEIGAFVRDEGLTFIGFDLLPHARQRYGSRFPDDRSLTDLAHWQRFETENPDTFAGMYQFWTQKN